MVMEGGISKFLSKECNSSLSAEGVLPVPDGTFLVVFMTHATSMKSHAPLMQLGVLWAFPVVGCLILLGGN